MKLMKNLARSLTLTVALGLSATAFNAGAALPVGAKAPTFELQGALAGKPIAFSLQQALQKGPVVLYFFPAIRSAISLNWSAAISSPSPRIRGQKSPRSIKR